MNLNKLYNIQNGIEFWNFLGEQKYSSFSSQQKIEVDEILGDLMFKVKENFDLIHKRLEYLNYNFFDKKEARIQPTDDLEKRLQLLSKYIEKGGLIPLSLKKFYTIVGGVDFMKDYYCPNSYPVNNEKILPDPVVIPYLTDDFLEYIEADFNETTWEKEELEEYIYPRGLPLAPDLYHKNNYSGGEPYCIRLSKNGVRIDDFFSWTEGAESVNVTFIEYLRGSFKWGGFPEIGNDYEEQPIEEKRKVNEFVNYLKEGLKEI